VAAGFLQRRRSRVCELQFVCRPENIEKFWSVMPT
jgi:hypothetical protein